MTTKIWKRFKREFSVYVGIGVAVSLVSAINVFYFQKLLDAFGQSMPILNLVIYGLTIIFVPIFSYLEKKPKMKLQSGIFFYLKEMALDKISRISYSEYLKIGSGSLLQKVEAGSSAGRNIHLNFYGRLFRELIPETFFNLFFIAIIDLKLVPAILLGYIFIFIVTKYLLKILQAIKENSLISEEIMNNTLIRGITEMVTFRINKRYKKEIANYHEMSISTTNNLIKMTMIHEFFFGFFAFLVAVIKLVIVILTFANVISISLGGLVALVTYVDRVYTPIAIFNVVFVQYHLDKVTYQRLQDFYDTSNDEGLFIEGAPIQSIATISLTNLNLTIQNKRILKDFNLDLEKDKIYGLVGESGAGKSSLMKVILGLFKPTSGDIFVNHKNLSSYNLNEYYDHIFYLSQDAPIFQGTLKETIVFDKNIPDIQVIEALEKCQLGHFYHSLEEGLDTRIGEKGSNISGGEKQRIAFARMFFSTAEIIVIDEATSALDESTEEKLLKEVMKIFKNRIVLMITHRPKNLEIVDEVIVLSNGYKIR